MERLVEEIRRQRIALGYTQQAAADRAGFKQSSWSDVENNRKSPGFARLDKMARAVGLRVEWRLVPVGNPGENEDA